MQARAALGIPGDGPLVLSVGGVEPRKNSLRALEAMLRLRTRVPGLRWILAGGASIFEHSAYRSAFQARLREGGESTNTLVSELGVVADDRMPLLYRAADVLLHASLQEGFGLCVLEAMASGIPVVVTRGAPFDEFTDDQTALTVDPADPTSIADAVQEALFGDGSARVRASLKRAQGYSWGQSAQRHVAVYREGLARVLRDHAGGAACEREKVVLDA
jgi:glycosyltransferase involved in cell wall biosynthesis